MLVRRQSSVIRGQCCREALTFTGPHLAAAPGHSESCFCRTFFIPASMPMGSSTSSGSFPSGIRDEIVSGGSWRM